MVSQREDDGKVQSSTFRLLPARQAEACTLNIKSTLADRIVLLGRLLNTLNLGDTGFIVGHALINATLWILRPVVN